MRRPLFLKMIIVNLLIPLSLCGCGPAAVNVSSATPTSPNVTATPEPKTNRVEANSTLPQADAQSTTEPAQTTTPQATTVAQTSANPSATGGSKEERAQEVLRQVREVLGGETKLNEIQGFSASGPFRRVANEQEQSGDMRLDLLLPDKFKVSETLNLIAGLELTIVSALNGDNVWTDTHSSSSNAQVTMVRRKGNEQQANDEQLNGLRADFTRYLLALFMKPPPTAAIVFVYGGEAEAADGRADVLDLKGANGFTARLFIDKKTHRPLMMSYRDVVMRMKTMKSSGGNLGDVDKIVKGAQAKTPSQQESDVQLRFSDYRAEKGVLLPHLIAKTVNGQPFEEWEVKNFKFNPPELTVRTFEKGK
jgi:hypothetical protein